MIEIIGLTKRFGRTLAVDNLSFVVPPGQVTGFLGPNGAGKSSTLRMMVGLDRPDAGQALINGRPYRELRHPLRIVGALLDARWVHPRRTARAHLRWLARSHGLPQSRVDEVLDRVGLTSVADRRAGGFSLGMAQRLGIAVALLGDPEILLFDEPINGLDPEGIHWVRGLTVELAAEGRAVLVSSHLLTEMSLTARQLVVIGRGRLVAACSTAEFVSRAGTSTVRVRSPQPDRLVAVMREHGMAVHTDGRLDATTAVTVVGASTDDIGQLAGEHGIVLYELTPHLVSLEEAFISMTRESVEFRPAVAATEVVREGTT